MSAVDAARRWWERPFSAFQTNLREIDAGLDVDRVLDFIEDFGAGAWLLNTGGIISNYPTDLDFQTRNPVLAERASGDLLGDAACAAESRGIRLLCRMDFSKIPAALAELHPDWCFIAPDGGIQEYNGLVSVCPNGGYYRSAVLEVLAEVIGRYPVDGFFFNWFSFNEVGYDGSYRGVCHCGPCQRAFAEFAATDGADPELPNGPEDLGYERWRRFSAACLADLNDLLHGHISGLDPDVALIRGDQSDIVWHEANNAVGRDLWATATADEVAVAKTWRPDKAVLVNAVAFLDMPYRFAAEEPATMQQYLAQTISRGGNPSTYVMGTPDLIEYSGLSAAAQVVRFHRDHRDLYEGLRPAAEVAVVRPDPARPFDAIRRAEYEGIVLALRRAGVPVDVVAEEHLADVLGGEEIGIRVIVLGDLGALDRTTSATADDWVQRGGRVLATGSTGLRTDGHDLASAGIDGRISTRRGDELRNSYVIADASEAAEGSIRGNPLALYGAYHYLRPGVETTSDHLVLSRAPFGPPEKCYGNRVTEHPGRLRSAYGSGLVVTIPWTVGAAYRELELTALSDHLVQTVRELVGGASQVSLQAPGPVDVSVGRRGDDLVVHLINLSGARRRNFDEPAPLPVQLTVRDVAAEEVVELLNGSTGAEVVRRGRDAEITIPSLATFEVVTITRAGMPGQPG